MGNIQSPVSVLTRRSLVQLVDNTGDPYPGGQAASAPRRGGTRQGKSSDANVKPFPCDAQMMGPKGLLFF